LTGAVYGLTAAVMGLGFLVHVLRVFRDQDGAGITLNRDAPARASFKFSILYLFVLFGALAVDRFVG
ncbi:MAG: protoheme IX farnesyltransferase, partial [Acetobacteraceae bacterium]|nr:protoheme IX farnesyltransferase [Acetobacteraceae bacterium]